MRTLIAASILATSVVAPTYELRAQLPAAQAWEIGPIIRGRSRSLGMPRTPTPGRQGWSFDFPYPHAGAGHVHYVTFHHGPLVGKRRIVMRYRIDAARGVRFIPQEQPQSQATLALYFQRAGDTWRGRGPYEHYRWWAPYNTIVPVTPGEHRVVVNLSPDWVSIFGKTGRQVPDAYRASIAETSRVGFVLGHIGGRGHGVFATGPARMTVLSFQVI